MKFIKVFLQNLSLVYEGNIIKCKEGDKEIHGKLLLMEQYMG